MKTLGIVAEYNPFHNGHAFHLDRAKTIVGAKYTIAVMSGNFVQRGEPAIVDKRTRTHMALHAGVDIVLELPLQCAAASAKYFARGAVGLLAATGVVDAIAFGAEAKLAELKEAARLVREEPYADALKEGLSRGLSYPRARAEAVGGRIGDILRGPNNILAIEYINAIEMLEGHIECIAIGRTVAHNDGMIGGFASASCLRRMLLSGQDISEFVPNHTRELLEAYGCLHSLDNLSGLFHYRIRMLGPEGLRNIAEVSEGLEHRILRCARETYLISDIITRIKTKRYTQSKIRRIILYIVLGVTRDRLQEPPGCIRLLGMRKGSEELLRRISQASSLPLITTPRGKVTDHASTNTYYLSATTHDKRLEDARQEYRLPTFI